MDFNGFIKEVFDTLEDYVITPENLMERERQEMENTKSVLRDLEASGDGTRMKPFDVHFPSNSRIDDRTRDLKMSKDVRKGKKLSCISPTEQGCVTKWCDDI